MNYKLVLLITIAGLIGFSAIAGLRTIKSAGASSAIHLNVSPVAAIGKTVARLGWRTTQQDTDYGVVAEVSSERPYLLGRTYLGVPALLIPRSIWPQKPSLAGPMVTHNVYHVHNNNMPLSVFGEAYWNFGPVGIVLVLAVFGAILGVFASTYRRQPRSAVPRVLYFLLLFFWKPSGHGMMIFLHVIIPVLVILGVSFMVTRTNNRLRIRRCERSR